MLRTMLALGIFSVALFSSTPSQAQGFYESGEVSIAIERALGIHYVHQEWDGPGDREFDGTTFGVGWYQPLTALHLSRAAIDVFVIDQLSVGGSLGFFAQSGDPDNDGILFAPRGQKVKRSESGMA